MIVKSKEDAWFIANLIMKHDYELDSERSKNAGYPIYFTTEKGGDSWISDLGDRLEVNIGANSTSIWMEEAKCVVKNLEDRIVILEAEINEEAGRMARLAEQLKVTKNKYRFANLIEGCAKNILIATENMEELKDRMTEIQNDKEERK